MGHVSPFAERHVIVFDFDGTIADTKASIISTATTVLLEWGLPEESLVRVGDIIGPPFPQAFEEVFGLEHEDAVEVTRRYRDIYTKLGVEAWPTFAGVNDMLQALHDANRGLAIASSKRAPLVCKGLSDNGILELFYTVQARDSEGTLSKADAIAAALCEAEVGPYDAVMVGDRFHDVEAARACGVDCIGVLYGDTGTRAELEDAGALAVVDTVAELRALLGV